MVKDGGELTKNGGCWHTIERSGYEITQEVLDWAFILGWVQVRREREPQGLQWERRTAGRSEGPTEKSLSWDMCLPVLCHVPLKHGPCFLNHCKETKNSAPQTVRELLWGNGDSQTHKCTFQRGWTPICLTSWWTDKDMGNFWTWFWLIDFWEVREVLGLMGKVGSEQDALSPLQVGTLLVKTFSFSTNCWVICKGTRWPSPSLLSNNIGYCFEGRHPSGFHCYSPCSTEKLLAVHFETDS